MPPYILSRCVQTTALIGAGFIMQHGGVVYTYFVSVYFARGSTLTHFAAVCGHSIQGPRVTTAGTLSSNQNITLDCVCIEISRFLSDFQCFVPW